MSNSRKIALFAKITGFTLIEVALGLAIFGMLLGGGLLVTSKLWERDRREEARIYLQQAKAALLDFARKNGRFPYADIGAGGGDGIENVNAFGGGLWGIGVGYYVDPSCNANYPPNCFIPYNTLQIPPKDPFNAILKYQMVAKGGAGMAFPPSGNVTCTDLKDYFRNRNSLRLISIHDIDTNVYIGAVAVLISPSEHSYIATTTTNPTNTQFDGEANRTNNGYTSFGQYFQGFLSPGKIDDQLIYISPMELYEALQCDSPAVSL